MSEQFLTTQWSVVLAAGAEQPQALEALCAAYWAPLHAYVRWRGHGPEEARDLTQEFFARLLERKWLEGIQQEGGRFRGFLLTALQRFLANSHERATAAKRGGGIAPIPLEEIADPPALAEGDSPERAYDRQWARLVLERAHVRLRKEAEAAKLVHFPLLERFLSTDPDPGEYDALAAHLGQTTNSLAAAVYRLRRRFREAVLAEVRETVAEAGDAEEEMASLLAALG